MSKNKNKNIKEVVKAEQVSSSSFITSVWIALLITFACFYNTLQNKFVNWDDDQNFVENPLVVNFNKGTFIENTIEIFKSPTIGNYNPLSILSLAIDKAIYGLDNPSGFHFTNLLLHLICVILVYQLVLALKLSRTTAFFVALLFGIHPMRVESVAWVTERKDVLFATFYLAALLQYTKHRLKLGLGRSLFILLLFTLSLFSKIQAVALPLSMIAIDYYFDKKFTLKQFLTKLPYFTLSIVFGVIGIIFLSSEGSLDANQAVSYPIWTRPFIGTFSLVVYTIKALIPFRLSPLYPYPASLPWYVYPTIIIVPALLYGMYKAYIKGYSLVLFGLLFFGVNIIFLLQVVGAGQGFLADRFTYVPYIGLFIIMVDFALNQAENGKFKQLIKPLCMVILLVYGGMTFAQNRIWENSETLWTHVLKYYQNITLPFGNRANFRRDNGNTSGALADYERAIALKPSAQTYNSRARLYFDIAGTSLDTLQMALADYNKAIEMDSTEGEFYSNRGATKARLGQFDEAIIDLNKAIELDPSYPTSLLNRSVLYNQRGDLVNALNDIEAYLKLKPLHADLWFEGGRIYALQKSWDKSLAMLNKAIQIDPSKGLYYYQRGLSNLYSGKIAIAKSDMTRAIQLGYTEADPMVLKQAGL